MQYSPYLRTHLWAIKRCTYLLTCQNWLNQAFTWLLLSFDAQSMSVLHFASYARSLRTIDHEPKLGILLWILGFSHFWQLCVHNHRSGFHRILHGSPCHLLTFSECLNDCRHARQLLCQQGQKCSFYHLLHFSGPVVRSQIENIIVLWYTYNSYVKHKNCVACSTMSNSLPTWNGQFKSIESNKKVTKQPDVQLMQHPK